MFTPLELAYIDRIAAGTEITRAGWLHQVIRARVKEILAAAPQSSSSPSEREINTPRMASSPPTGVPTSASI